jgi:hypothetical protein
MTSLVFHPAARAGVLADSINDADSTRKVYLLAAGLAALGIILIAMTVWFWRSTRHDPELLAPLETMGSRRFRKLDDGSKRQLLDAVRPADATPMRWGVVRGSATAEPEVDLAAIRHATVRDYDDLRDPVAVGVPVIAAHAGLTDAGPQQATVVDGGDVADDLDARDHAPELDDSSDPADAAASAASVPMAERPTDERPVDDPLLRPVIEVDRPRFKPDPRAFVIAPLDHDMPPMIDDEAAVDAASGDPDGGGDDATHTGARPPVIDPLLRRFERSD